MPGSSPPKLPSTQGPSRGSTPAGHGRAPWGARQSRAHRRGHRQRPTGPGLGLIRGLSILTPPGFPWRSQKNGFSSEMPRILGRNSTGSRSGSNPQINKRHGFKTCRISESRWLKLSSADDKRCAARPDLAHPSLLYTSPLQCRRLPELKLLSLVSLVLETWNEKESYLKGHNLMHLPAIFSETSCVTLHFKLTSLLL